VYTSPPSRVSPLAPLGLLRTRWLAAVTRCPDGRVASLAPEAENRSASAPSRISTHTVAMFHDSTAVVRHACTSLLAVREGVHGKG